MKTNEVMDPLRGKDSEYGVIDRVPDGKKSHVVTPSFLEVDKLSQAIRDILHKDLIPSEKIEIARLLKRLIEKIK